MRYWSQTLTRTVLAFPAKKTLTIADLRDETYITADDIIATLQYMDVLEHKKKGGAQLVINKESLRTWAETHKVSLEDPVDPDAFVIENEESEAEDEDKNEDAEE